MLSFAAVAGVSAAETTILNASYDVARGLYKDLNSAFQQEWKSKTGEDLTINMSHGGSSKQARAVLDGLAADVVTMNQDTDIEVLAKRGNLVAPDWRTRLPDHAAPFTSTILFLVRPGNPKGIRDWDDLVKPGVQVIIPNPKVTGNGRYSYLAAWAFALKKSGGDEAKAREFVTALFRNVPVLDSGGRAATTTFAQRGIGDVLLTFENEVNLIRADPTLGGGKLEIVVPSLSILAENPVSVVDRVVDQRGTRAVSEAYLRWLFTPEAQAIGVRHFYRPRNRELLEKNAELFKQIPLVKVDETFGGWSRAQAIHFDDGGVFDQIYSK
ncbi:thiosulfate transporter subunit [Verrucomicrobia bacterium SCGC AG-212-E04]|nr:thiosulfate transporter subunit [Verrucomicrobia bacterium SCGC AG-212-E04]